MNVVSARTPLLAAALCALLLIGLAVAGANAAELPAAPAATASPDSLPARALGTGPQLQRVPGLFGATPRPSLALPSFSLSYRTYVLESTPDFHLSRFDTGLLGADRGAFAGVALGFLGTETGLWNQRTSWYLMGAGAALGALWGSTLGKDSPSFRIRIEPGFDDTSRPERWDHGP